MVPLTRTICRQFPQTIQKNSKSRYSHIRYFFSQQASKIEKISTVYIMYAGGCVVVGGALGSVDGAATEMNRLSHVRGARKVPFICAESISGGISGAFIGGCLGILGPIGLPLIPDTLSAYYENFGNEQDKKKLRKH